MPKRSLGEFGEAEFPDLCANAAYTTLNDFASFGLMITENPLFRGIFGISIIRDLV